MKLQSLWLGNFQCDSLNKDVLVFRVGFFFQREQLLLYVVYSETYYVFK